MTYSMPRNTKDNFLQRGEKCSNLSLWLDRYISAEIEGKDKFEFYDKKIKSIFTTSPYIAVNDHGLIAAYYKRWEYMAKALPHAKTFTASPEWRMIVGLGQASILETAMTLDRVTGIPIIPASALKGLAASYAMLSVLETTVREEAEKDPDFVAIFGKQDQMGKVIFLDAVPTIAPTLEPDIMNCHYQEYYGDRTGTKLPTPYQSPIPVYFLTLGRKSEFGFAVAGRDRSNATAALVRLAEGWLKNGLQELGIGAKTAAGYGYLEVNES